MDRESVKVVVRVTLIVLARIAARTTTLADDWMTSILGANEERLVDAVVQLSGSAQQPPTEEQVIAALASVGIKL